MGRVVQGCDTPTPIEDTRNVSLHTFWGYNLYLDSYTLRSNCK